MTYVETTRYSHFKSINITAARLTCTSDLCHLRRFRRLQQHLNYMPGRGARQFVKVEHRGL